MTMRITRETTPIMKTSTLPPYCLMKELENTLRELSELPPSKDETKRELSRKHSGLKRRTNPFIPNVERVIFNEPATIVFFDDGTKSVVKCEEGDTYSKEAGLALAISKRMLGKKEFHKVFERFLEE